MIIVGIALLGFLLLAIIGRRAAQIILISGIAGMILLFGWNLLRSELRSSAIRQEAAAAHVARECPSPPYHKPSNDLTDCERNEIFWASLGSDPDYDKDGNPTTAGLMRRMERISPTH